MPIAAQCGSCAARYKIVDTASGRRVRCRRCGKPFVVPGAAPIEHGPDLRALADLERKGQVVTASAEAEFENYRATIATLTQASDGEKDAANAKRKAHGRSVLDVATPDYLKKNDVAIAQDGRKKGNPYVKLATTVVAVCAIGAVLWIVVPKMMNGGLGFSSATPKAPPPRKLNSFGEIQGTGTTQPTILNGLYAYQRPEAPVQRILYYINLGTGIDPSLHPPAGFAQELDQLLKDRIKSNGLIEFNEAHLACYLHVTDMGARGQMFTESNGTYVPDENGKISAKVPYLRCSFALDGDGGRLLHEEKQDMREIKEPIKVSSVEELQKAIDAHQWKGAMDWFKGLHLPDKPMWTEYDQGHYEVKREPSTKPSQTQESSSPAPDAKATGQ